MDQKHDDLRRSPSQNGTFASNSDENLVLGHENNDQLIGELRAQAEERLRESASTLEAEHEIAVHETELEIQNEELRASQARLEESRREFFALYDLAPVGYVTLDEKGVIRRANLSAATLLSEDRRTLVGRPFSVFVCSKSQSKFYSHIGQVFGSEASSTCTCELELGRESAGVPAHRMHRWVQLTSDLVTADGGELFMAMTDITSRVDAESALRERESRLRLISDHAPYAIAVVDSRGSLLEANDTWHRIVGGSEGLAGESIFGLFDGGAALARELRCGQLQVGPIDLLHLESGCSFRCTGTQAQLREEESTEWLLLLEDQSERVRAEERADLLEHRLQHLRRERLRALGELAGGIAHDFNNSLAAILSGTESAQLCEGLPSDTLEDLTLVKEAALTARSLVKRILSFARPEEVRDEPFDLTTALQRNAALVRAVAPRSITIDYEAGEPLEIRGDMAQVDQVLVNVLTNAVQALGTTGGRIEITATRAPSSRVLLQNTLLRGKDFCEICIRDDGPGMQADTLERIFDPYFTTRGDDGGSGLGLATAHNTISAHGGALFADSEFGVGSTFRILLPILSRESKGDVLAGSESMPRPRNQGKRHLLLVDDEHVVRESMRRLFEHMGVRVTACRSALEALDTVRHNPGEYSLVLSDLSMPKHSGLWLTRALQKEDQDLPVVIATGNREWIDLSELEASQPIAVLEKPLTLEELRSVIVDHARDTAAQAQ